MMVEVVVILRRLLKLWQNDYLVCTPHKIFSGEAVYIFEKGN